MTNTKALEYRPKTWEEVVGQEIPVKVLRNSLKTGMIKPAYLLAGLTGSGKTTSAQIFARALICENPADQNPCGSCRQCTLFDKGMNPDIKLFDSGSSGGVDFVREVLKPYLAHASLNGKFKVAILDEAHLMTRQAISNLLVLFEQMPQAQSKSVVIMCTTDGQAIDPAIQNRSLCLNFTPIDPEQIAMAICDKSGYDYEAVLLLARESGGSFRTIWSHLEKIELLGETLTTDLVYKLLGSVSKQERLKLWTYLSAGKVDEVAKLWKQWANTGTKSSVLGQHLIQDLVEWATAQPDSMDWRKPLALLSSVQISSPESAWPHSLFMLSGLPLDLQLCHWPEPEEGQPHQLLGAEDTLLLKRLLAFGA